MYGLDKEEIGMMLKLAREKVQKSPELRLGQAYFNILNWRWPEIANTIRASKLDMFYANIEDLYNILQVLELPNQVKSIAYGGVSKSSLLRFFTECIEIINTMPDDAKCFVASNDFGVDFEF